MHSVFFWLPGVCIICTFACKLPYCLIIEQNHYRALKISLENQADPGIPEILGFRVTIDYWKQQQQWSLLNRFRTEQQGHCGACRRKWRLSDTDLCPCGETQTMSHIVESCHLTKLNGGLSRLTLQMRTLFRGWPIMVNDTHTRRRRLKAATNKITRLSLSALHASFNTTNDYVICRLGKYTRKISIKITECPFLFAESQSSAIYHKAETATNWSREASR